ncbi:MAG: hypothetical protein D3922_00390 [Candidatus Electrothrix sp. AR1]|nr:hypothetical protein [Candidatus Electrothrix sp. AR1]
MINYTGYWLLKTFLRIFLFYGNLSYFLQHCRKRSGQFTSIVLFKAEILFFYYTQFKKGNSYVISTDGLNQKMGRARQNA